MECGKGITRLYVLCRSNSCHCQCTFCHCACRGVRRCMTQSLASAWTRATSRNASWM